MIQEPNLEHQLRASIEMAHVKRARELLEAGHAAALLVAKVARKDTGEIILGCGFSVDVVRAFAQLAGTESHNQRLSDGSGIAWAKVNVGGVTISIQGRTS